MTRHVMYVSSCRNGGELWRSLTETLCAQSCGQSRGQSRWPGRRSESQGVRGTSRGSSRRPPHTLSHKGGWCKRGVQAAAGPDRSRGARDGPGREAGGGGGTPPVSRAEARPGRAYPSRQRPVLTGCAGRCFDGPDRYRRCGAVWRD